MQKYERHDNLPGIPRAPVLRFHNVEEYNFERVKEQCTNKLPFLSNEDVLRLRKPYNYLIQQLLTEGYDSVVEEILQLKQKEESQVNFCKKKGNPSLTTQMKLLVHITDVLKYCYNTVVIQKKYMEGAKARFQLAEELIDTQDSLAHHFLLTSLALTKFAHKDENCLEFQAKLHCFLGYIERKNFEEDVEIATKHLEKARTLSRNKSWWFHTSIIKVDVEKPISACGLRDDKEAICCTGMSVYRVATLLYYDILMKMIKETTSLHLLLTKEDYDIVIHLSEEVLQMAREIRNPLVIASALTRYGILLRKSGALNEALEIFNRLSHHSELNHDFESMAIAYGNIAHCLHERRYPLEALEWFYHQSQLANEKKLADLEAEGIERMGYILLQEGQNAEAEQCIYEAYEEFVEATASTKKKNKRQKTFVDTSWAMAGVTSGMNMWGRFGGLCRHNDEMAINSLLNWKDGRWLLRSVPKSNNDTPHRVHDFFDSLDEKKIPNQPDCDLDCLRRTYHQHFRTFQMIDPKNLHWDNPLLSGRNCEDDDDNYDEGYHHRQHHRHDNTKRKWSFGIKWHTVKEKLVDRQSHQVIESEPHTSFELAGDGGRAAAASSSEGGSSRRRRHQQVSIMSDATSGTPKMSAVSISASSDSIESTYYASDQWSQSSEDRRKKLIGYSSSTTTNSTNPTMMRPHGTLGLYPMSSVYKQDVSTTMSQLEFQRKSVAHIHSHINIVNPDLVLHRELPIDFKYDRKRTSSNKTPTLIQENVKPQTSPSSTPMRKRSSGLAKGSSGSSKRSSGLTKGSSGSTKGSSGVINRSSGLTKGSSGSTKGSSGVTNRSSGSTTRTMKR